MEEEKKLYPLGFTTLEDNYDWGKEEFKLADLGYRDTFVREGWLAGNMLSEIMDMYMDSVVGENVFRLYGRQFPFQIKEITVAGKMPLMVHPDDTTAEERYDALGKEKLWIVLKAGKGAALVLGFKHDSNAGELYSACTGPGLEGLLNVRPVSEGEYFVIPSGTPHAAIGDMTILEVSESSGLDFCLSGWGQEASDALDFIDYRAWKEPEAAHQHAGQTSKKLAALPQFTVSTLRITDPIHIYSEQFDSAIAYYCVSGKASFQVKDPNMGTSVSFTLDNGKVLLIPADVPDFIVTEMAPDTELIEVYVEKREESDPYIKKDDTSSQQYS